MKIDIVQGILNDEGYVLVLTMFLLLMLTVIGLAAIDTSGMEMRISSNSRSMVETFYLNEGALVTVLEHSDQWLDDAFLNQGERAAHWSGRVDSNNDGVDDTLVEVRCIEESESKIEGLSDAANMIPVDRHVSSAPVGSGFSIRHFEVRKFAATATNLSDGKKIQVGAWKVFDR